MLAALAAARVVGLIFGTLLAFPALRLEGPQFALATLSFSALSATTLNEWEGLPLGAQGLQVSRPPFLGMPLDAPGFFWLCLLLLALVWLVLCFLLFLFWVCVFV